MKVRSEKNFPERFSLEEFKNLKLRIEENG